MKNYSEINSCPVTGDSKSIKYFTLGKIPIVNNLYSDQLESLNCEKFPIELFYFPSSGASSLGIAIHGEILFSHYLYKSEVNKPYYEHCQQMFNYLKKFLDIKSNTQVIDIGGNDGTLLSAFRETSEHPIKLLNIDASVNLTDLCRTKGIDAICDFFSYEKSKNIGVKSDIIISTNVFQHLKDIDSFTRGIENLLTEDGIWLLEFPYWIHDMQTNQFDQIYHEHIYYHSVRPIKMLVEKHNLKIINVSFHEIHGGSLRLIIAREDSVHKSDETVDFYLQKEEKIDISHYTDWGMNVNKHILVSKNFLESLISKGNKIFGFGASAKGCVYLNSMNITSKEIEYIIDDTDIKQNKYLPGTGIKIVSREILKKVKPDYILILSHNFSEHIIDSLKNEYDGNFIVLLPEIKII